MKPPASVPAPDHDPRGLQIASDAVAQQLQQIAILTRKAASHLADALSINQTDMAALEHLITDGPSPPTELASRLSVTTAGIPPGLDRLARAGHVIRERQLDGVFGSRLGGPGISAHCANAHWVERRAGDAAYCASPISGMGTSLGL